jgi:tripartite-type tricarboxylate transporter receptor subunit TctC
VLPGAFFARSQIVPGTGINRLMQNLAWPRVACAACALALLTPASASAQNYPAKPIRFVVPFAPGGVADMLGRTIGQKLLDAWGQQVVVENRGGAGGNIGLEFVAKSGADGYTLGLGNLGTLAINPSVYKRMPFDPTRDFAPISLVAGTPLLLVVHPSVPVKSVKELIAFAKARPGQLNFASAGTGGPTHLAGEMFNTMAGIAAIHVPYKGNIAALTALVGGEAHMMFTNLLTPLPFVKSGRLRGLAVSSRRRQPAMPEIPTVAEAGVPEFEVSGWYGVLAPAGTPREIVLKLNAEIVRFMQAPDVQAQFAQQGVEIFTSTPEQLASQIKSDLVKWSKVVKSARASID